MFNNDSWFGVILDRSMTTSKAVKLTGIHDFQRASTVCMPPVPKLVMENLEADKFGVTTEGLPNPNV